MTLTDRPELDPDDPIDGWLLHAMRSHSTPQTPTGSVLAHIIDRGKWLEIRAILAGQPRTPGDVGRWLDALPTDRKIIVPAVVSPRLAGMLERRGFQPHAWYDLQIRDDDDNAYMRDLQENPALA